MIIINTTFHVHSSIVDDLLKWIENIYKQNALEKGASSPLLVKILGYDQPDSSSYALHLTFPDLQLAEAWNDTEGNYLRHTLSKHWGEKALSFYTYLQVID